MEELQRALREQGLTVSLSPGKGRCLFTTTTPFSPGEVIISRQPYISVPNNTSDTARCEVCFASVNAKKCSACHVVWYCGTACQKADWTLHRVECQALLKLEKEKLKHLTPSIRLMVKLYIRRRLQDEKIIPTTVTDNYSLIEALESHMSEIDEKQSVSYAQMADLVGVILQWPGLKVKEVAENFSKFARNALIICDPELRHLGTGLYTVISFINHSCLPNAVLMFEGRTAVVRAVQHIPKGPNKLYRNCWKHHHATEGSKRTGQCEDVQESAILEGYRCDDHTCMGFLLQDPGNEAFICQQCGHVRKLKDIQRVASEVETFSEKAAVSFKSRTYEEAGSLYRTVEKLQLKLCHSSSLNLMRTRDSLMKISMELNNWKDALFYCRLTIPVYEMAYPGCHPMLGLQYYTCGKLEWLLGETENCIRSLSKALDILRVTHGTNTSFIKELVVKLEEARAEASFQPKPFNE